MSVSKYSLFSDLYMRTNLWLDVYDCLILFSITFTRKESWLYVVKELTNTQFGLVDTMTDWDSEIWVQFPSCARKQWVGVELAKSLPKYLTDHEHPTRVTVSQFWFWQHITTKRTANSVLMVTPKSHFAMICCMRQWAVIDEIISDLMYLLYIQRRLFLIVFVVNTQSSYVKTCNMISFGLRNYVCLA